MKRCTKATFGPPLRLTFLLHGVNQRFYTLVPLTVKDDRTSTDVASPCSSEPSCDTCPRFLGTHRGTHSGRTNGDPHRLLTASSPPPHRLLDRLLDAACRLFSSSSVPATTVREITTAAGVSSPRRRDHRRARGAIHRPLASNGRLQPGRNRSTPIPKEGEHLEHSTDLRGSAAPTLTGRLSAPAALRSAGRRSWGCSSRWTAWEQ